jgi:4-amino-4-deoxy-L-arabinose transferase-like glycosyltransferase
VPSAPFRPSRAGILAGALFAVFASATILWLALDRAPPNWDDAWYLTNSLIVYDALSRGGIAGYISELNSVFGFKAPLIAALPTPFYLIFGRRWHAAYLVNIASMALLFFAMYRIARRFLNTRAAVLSIAVAGTMPLLYGLARWFLVEYALTALVALAVYILIEGGLEESRTALLFGCVCGLGLLLKVSFPVYILPALLYAWIGSRYRLRLLVLTSLACLTLAAPWYASHLRPVLANAADAGFGASAAVQGTGAIFTFRAIGVYLARVAGEGLSSYYAWLTALLIAWAALRPGGRAFLRSFVSKPLVFVPLWLMPFALFLFGGNKDVRYIAPVLPAFCLLTAALADFAVPRNAAGNLLAGLIVLIPGLQMSSVSYGIPYASANLPYARRFTPVAWPLDRILMTIAANTRLRPGERQMVLIGSDRGSFNANNLELSAVALRLPFDVETTAHQSDLNTLLQRLDQASFFVFKEGGEPESPFFNPHFESLVRRARENARYRALPFEGRLPDGGVARILKNSAEGPLPASAILPPDGREQEDGFAIHFGDVAALTGFSLQKTAESLIVNWRWRCLKPPDREYWCFTHVIDSQGRIVSQFDHRLPGARPSWTPGARFAGQVRLSIPPELPAGDLRLRFGLYDPQTGERLRFGALDGRPASLFTAADQSTALLTPIR